MTFDSLSATVFFIGTGVLAGLCGAAEGGVIVLALKITCSLFFFRLLSREKVSDRGREVSSIDDQRHRRELRPLRANGVYRDPSD